MKVSQLRLKNFTSCKTIEEVINKLGPVSLDTDCTAAQSRREGNWSTKQNVVLSFGEAERIGRFLLSHNLEFSENEEVIHTESYDDYKKRIGGNPYQGGGYIEQLQARAKRVQFKTGIGKCIELSNALDPLGIPFNVSWGWYIEFFCELDFYVKSLQKSEDSEQVKKLNEKRWTSLRNRRMVKQVTTKLDREG